MSRRARRLLAATLLVAGLVVGGVAASARAEEASTGIAADRFAPAIGPLVLGATEGGELTGPGVMRAALALDYLRDPLRLDTRYVGGTLSYPVSGALVANLAIEAGLARRVAAAVELPLTLAQSGDRLASTGVDLRGLAAPVAGDLRLRLKVLVVDRARGHLAALVEVGLPVGGQNDFAATAGPTTEPRVEGDLALGRVILMADAGYRLAPDRSLFQTRFGDELTWAGGAVVRALERRGLAGSVYVEGAGAVGPSPGTRPVEARAAVRVARGALALDLGGGAGLDEDAQAPAWRVFAILRARTE